MSACFCGVLGTSILMSIAARDRRGHGSDYDRRLAAFSVVFALEQVHLAPIFGAGEADRFSSSGGCWFPFHSGRISSWSCDYSNCWRVRDGWVWVRHCRYRRSISPRLLRRWSREFLELKLEGRARRPPSNGNGYKRRHIGEPCTPAECSIRFIVSISTFTPNTLVARAFFWDFGPTPRTPGDIRRQRRRTAPRPRLCRRGLTSSFDILALAGRCLACRNIRRTGSVWLSAMAHTSMRGDWPGSALVHDPATNLHFYAAEAQHFRLMPQTFDRVEISLHEGAAMRPWRRRSLL